MNKYLFSTYTCVKPYLDKKYWVDGDIIRDRYINADTVEDALIEFKDKAAKEDGIIISKNAMKRKNKMYRDYNGTSAQTGFVITGKTEIYDRDYNINGVNVYLDLWVKIEKVTNPFDGV